MDLLEFEKKKERAFKACSKYLPDAEHDNLLDVMLYAVKRTNRIGLGLGFVLGLSASYIYYMIFLR